MCSPSTHLINHNHSLVPYSHGRHTTPKSLKHRLFFAGVTEVAVATKFSLYHVSPSIHCNALVPYRPNQEELLSSLGLIPKGFPLKLDHGWQDTRLFCSCQIPLKPMFLKEAFLNFQGVLHEGSAITPLVVLGVEG